MARIGVANTLGNREANTDTDERVLNGLVESQGGRRKTDKAVVFKRPGLTSTYAIGTGQGGATQGQGLFIMTVPAVPGIAGASDSLIAIRGDVITIPVS